MNLDLVNNKQYLVDISRTSMFTLTPEYVLVVANSLNDVLSLFDFSYYTINGTQVINGSPQTCVVNLSPKYDYWLEFCRKNNKVIVIN